MRSHLIRVLGLVVGLAAVLAMASIAAAAPLSDQQISRQIENRLSKDDALENVNVSVQASVVTLSGTVPSLWAREAAIAKAGELADVTSVVSDALEIESAESDGAIAEQIAKDIRRVSIPGPRSAARTGVSSPPGVAESTRPPSSFNHHGSGFGFDDHRFGFDHHGSEFGLDHHEDDTGDTEFYPYHHGAHRQSGFGSGHSRFGADAQLRAEIERTIYDHTGNAFYSIFDYLDGHVADGVVTLTGRVTHEYKASRIARLVSRVQGVKEIHNQIEVLPASSFDDQLRASLARNIYGDPLFWNYAIQLNPPVHIIVDNLHVTLTGVVFSEVEKRVAADIVRQTVGVLTFQNNLEVETELKG